MNYPTFVLLFGLVFFAAFSSCGQDHTNDDTSKPADGDTGGSAASECEDEQAKIKALEAELELLKGEEPK